LDVTRPLCRCTSLRGSQSRQTVDGSAWDTEVRSECHLSWFLPKTHPPPKDCVYLSPTLDCVHPEQSCPSPSEFLTAWPAVCPEEEGWWPLVSFTDLQMTGTDNPHTKCLEQGLAHRHPYSAPVGGLGFELRASLLQSRHCLSHNSSPFFSGYFPGRVVVSELFARAGLKLPSSDLSLPSSQDYRRESPVPGWYSVCLNDCDQYL
jgi:hypothetical protein